MNLVIDGYVHELEGRRASHRIPADTLMSCGEYRYYYGHAYDGDRRVISPVHVTVEDDGWRNVLDQALLNLPTVEVKGDFLSYEDWKLGIYCSSESFINFGQSLLAAGNEADSLARLLRRFPVVSFRFTPPDKIEAYLASDIYVRQECF